MVPILPLSLLLFRLTFHAASFLQQGLIHQNTVEESQERDLIVLDMKKIQRIQESRFGVHRLLAIRVSSTLNETPVESLDEMEAAIFGTGPNPMNVPSDASLVAQFEAVSHGKLLYVPLEDPQLTRPGLLEITIETSTMKKNNDSTVNRFDSIVRHALMSEAARRLGRSVYNIADRVMFCLPSGSLEGSVAGIGEVGGMFTYFHLGYCRKLDALMHELGHNLHFHHSGIGPQEYGDMTDYMGGLEAPPSSTSNRRGPLKGNQPSTAAVAIDGAGYPKKAFNGHKHWTSGWFRDRSLEIYPLESNCTFHQRLVSFVEYGNEALESSDFVLLRAGSLYIQYNRAKGYNVDTSLADHVTVTEGFEDGSISVRVAALAEGQHCVIPNFDSSGHSLIIQVCTTTQEPSGKIDFADLIIYIENDDGPVPCSLDQKVQCERKPGSIFDRLLPQIDEPFQSFAYFALMVGFVIMTCVFILLCCICSRLFFIDRTAGAAKTGNKMDDLE